MCRSVGNGPGVTKLYAVDISMTPHGLYIVSQWLKVPICIILLLQAISTIGKELQAHMYT